MIDEVNSVSLKKSTTLLYEGESLLLFVHSCVHEKSLEEQCKTVLLFFCGKM